MIFKKKTRKFSSSLWLACAIPSIVGDVCFQDLNSYDSQFFFQNAQSPDDMEQC